MIDMLAPIAATLAIALGVATTLTALLAACTGEPALLAVSVIYGAPALAAVVVVIVIEVRKRAHK